MRVYCTSKNTGPSWSAPDPITMVYLGTSVKEAEEAVGEFRRYQKEEDKFPKEFLRGYSALPQNIEWEMVQYFMADGWWYSIVMFMLNEPAPQSAAKDAIIFSAPEACELVLDRMKDILAQYKVVSVSDMKELSGIEITHMDVKWGWRNLDGVTVQRVREGYTLVLPATEPLT